MSTQHSTDVSPRLSGSGIANVTLVEANRLVPWLMLTSILSGVAVALVLVLLYVHASSYRELEREVRLLQLQTDNMKVAMLAAGIDPAPHLEGEAP